jgi:uroporphyrinogen-III synthase
MPDFKKVKSILITQPKPESDRNPYVELSKKYNVKVDFREFIHVEGVDAREIRKDKIDLSKFSAVILTSRHAIEHYFRVAEEMKFEVPAEMKYFCTSEQISLYLQNFTQYRKRKIFFGNGTIEDLVTVINKHKDESYLFPCSDVRKVEIPKLLKKNKIKFSEVVFYKTVCSDLSDLSNVNYDIIAFFSPSGIKSLYENFPDFKQNETRIAAYGTTTHKAISDAGLKIDIKAPTIEVPSMTHALEEYIKQSNK